MARGEPSNPSDLLPIPSATFHILIALSDADLHGYAIIQDVRERTGGKVKINPGTLYTTIQRLLEQGLIQELEERPDPENDDERRRYYRLTAFGRSVAKAEAARLSDMLTLARQAGLAPRGI
jgi:DNA-binding PadR family transcriptional regulator